MTGMKIENWLVRNTLLVPDCKYPGTNIILVQFQLNQLCPNQLICMNVEIVLCCMLDRSFLWNKGKVTLCVITLPFPLNLHCLHLLFPPLLLITLKILLFFFGIKKYLSSFPHLFWSSAWSVSLSYMNVSYLLSDNVS